MLGTVDLELACSIAAYPIFDSILTDRKIFSVQPHMLVQKDCLVLMGGNPRKGGNQLNTGHRPVSSGFIAPGTNHT
jgi:hypothetical protein